MDSVIDKFFNTENVICVQFNNGVSHFVSGKNNEADYQKVSEKRNDALRNGKIIVEIVLNKEDNIFLK